MSNELLEELTKLNHDNMAAIKRFNENYTKITTYLTQQQMQMVSLYMEASAKQLEALSQAKSVPDLIAAQSRLSAELNEKLVNNARQTLQKLVKVMRFNKSDLEMLNGPPPYVLQHLLNLIDFDGPPPNVHDGSVNMIDPGRPPCETTSPPSSGCPQPKRP